MNKKQLLLTIAALGALCVPVQAATEAGQMPWAQQDAFWGLNKGQATATGVGAVSLAAAAVMLAMPSVRNSARRAIKAQKSQTIFQPTTTSDYIAAGLIGTLTLAGVAALISTPFLGKKAGAASASGAVEGTTADSDYPEFEGNVASLYPGLGDDFEAEDYNADLTNAQRRQAIFKRGQDAMEARQKAAPKPYYELVGDEKLTADMAYNKLTAAEKEKVDRARKGEKYLRDELAKLAAVDDDMATKRTEAEKAASIFQKGARRFLTRKAVPNAQKEKSKKYDYSRFGTKPAELAASFEKRKIERAQNAPRKASTDA